MWLMGEKLLKALEEMSDIDTSDTPETINWCNAVADKFYRSINEA